MEELEVRFYEWHAALWPVVALAAGILLAGFLGDRLIDLALAILRRDDDA